MRDIDAGREASEVDDERSRAGLGRHAFLVSAAVLAVAAALVSSARPLLPRHARRSTRAGRRKQRT